jgi:phenylacetate-CoA ligase
MRSFYLDDESIDRMQREKLARLIAFANEYIPYYRRTFKEAGIDPSSIKDRQSLLSVPFLTKDLINANYQKGLMAQGEAPAAVRRGTGTTRSSASVAHSQASLDIRHALFLRYLVLAGLRPWERMVTMWVPLSYWKLEPDSSGKMRPSTSLYGYPVWILGRPPPSLRILNSIPGDPLAEARALHKLKPRYLFGRPTQLRRVGRALEELHLEVPTKAVFVSAEVQTPGCAKELQRIFKSPVSSAMGTSETGGFACTCPSRKGFHLYEDFMVVEVLKDGEAALPGEVGEVAVTHLHNYLMPLIRYRTGDFVKVAKDGICDCGSSLPLIETVEGRVDDCLVDSEGRKVWAVEVADHIESEFGFTDFQIRQTSQSELIVELARGDMDKRATLPRLQSYLEALLGRQVSMEIRERQEADFWRKYKPVSNSVRTD